MMDLSVLATEATVVASTVRVDTVDVSDGPAPSEELAAPQPDGGVDVPLVGSRDASG